MFKVLTGDMILSDDSDHNPLHLLEVLKNPLSYLAGPKSNIKSEKETKIFLIVT